VSLGYIRRLKKGKIVFYISSACALYGSTKPE
jgi:hypothetical protein